VLESKYGGVVPKKEEKASPAEEYEIATKVSNVAKENWIHQAPVFEQIRELIEIKEKEEEMMKEQSLSFNLLEGNDESGGEDEEGGGEDEDCIKSSSKKKEFSSLPSNKNLTARFFHSFARCCQRSFSLVISCNFLSNVLMRLLHWTSSSKAISARLRSMSIERISFDSSFVSFDSSTSLSATRKSSPKS